MQNYKKRKVIMIGIDGGHRDTLYNLIKKKELPFFCEIVNNGVYVENAVTCFPATTIPCVSAMYTGCNLNRHAILNNVWMDRYTTPPTIYAYIGSPEEALKSLGKRFFGFPTIILPDSKEGGQVNNALSKEVQTIYEAVAESGYTSYSFFHYVGRGATKWVRPRIKDMLLFAFIEKKHRPYEPFEKAMITVTINHLRKFLPDITSIYFGCNDGNSHRNGVKDQARYLKTLIDPQLTRLKIFLLSKYPEYDFYFTITADHGQTEFEEKDKKNSLWIEDFKEIIKTTNPTISVDGGENKKISTDVDVLFTFGHGVGIGIYVRNKKSKNWQDQPDFENDVVPVLNAFIKVSEGYPGTENVSKKGLLDFLLTRRTFYEPYRVYLGRPPYSTAGELIELEEFFKGKSKYINPVERIRGIDSPKGPDIIVMLDYDKNKYQICGDFHPGNHGSLFADDSYIPMIFSGKGIKKGKIESARLIDYAPTVATIFGVEMTKADGKPLDIWE